MYACVVDEIQYTVYVCALMFYNPMSVRNRELAVLSALTAQCPDAHLSDMAHCFRVDRLLLLGRKVPAAGCNFGV